MVNIIACRIQLLSVTEQLKIEKLFLNGLKHYHSRDFFEAHEVWEELWSEYYLEDRKFIQGLIQLAVSFVHLGNGNMNGAKSLLRKCTEKFESFFGIHRGINVQILLDNIEQVRRAYEVANVPDDFDWNLVPSLD